MSDIPEDLRARAVEAGAKALCMAQSNGCCDDWPNRCDMCDCFRTEATGRYERDHMSHAIDVVLPLVAEHYETQRLGAAIKTSTVSLPYDVLRPAELKINLEMATDRRSQTAIEAAERIQLSHETLSGELAEARATIARTLAEHGHADTCGSTLSPGAGYPCSCWRAALRGDQ